MNITIIGTGKMAHGIGTRLLAGDDTQAKTTVADLIKAGGLRLLDVGPLQRARQLEGLDLFNTSVQLQMEKP